VVKDWMQTQFGPEAQFEAAGEGAVSVGKFVTDIPKLLGQAERAADAFSAAAEEGLRLDNYTVERSPRRKAGRTVQAASASGSRQ
jgi:ubiquinone biosynthesis protein